MTSNNDDLEQALQENLKLRSELAANVAKAQAASQRSGMGYRLGWVLYWTCLALIGLYATFWLVVLQDASWDAIIDDLSWSTILGLGLPVVGLYGIGRAFRYVLSGEQEQCAEPYWLLRAGRNGMTEIVYVLTNEAMPGLVKIGRTNDDLAGRIRGLYTSGVPLPFELFYACEVEDAYFVETQLHDAFGDHRVSRRREFFRIAPERVKAALLIAAIRENRDDRHKARDRTAT